VALTRYYIDAGAARLAVGVHTTQFAIRAHALPGPCSSLRETRLALAERLATALIAGVVGEHRQALDEAALARTLGYDAALLSLAALRDADDTALVSHCRRVAEVMPLFGFYLQTAVGGRALGYRFWREFAEIPNVVAIKIAPFNRYQTLDVVRAVVESGRDDIALYTGNDDAIVQDLVTPFDIETGDAWCDASSAEDSLASGRWTRRAVGCSSRCSERARATRSPRSRCHAARHSPMPTARSSTLLTALRLHPRHSRGPPPTGLLAGTWCLTRRTAVEARRASWIAWGGLSFLSDDVRGGEPAAVAWLISSRCHELPNDTPKSRR
jgi:hypothetical protein